MKSLFQNIIYNDIYNLLLSLHLLYNIDLELLTKIYMPNIIFNDPPNTKIIHRKKFSQCTARCWGGKKYVKYNPITKQWTYGYQCTRNSIHNSPFCLTHNNIFLKKNHLPHGIFNHSVPHSHYDKYKKKIEKKFNITY